MRSCAHALSTKLACAGSVKIHVQHDSDICICVALPRGAMGLSAVCDYGIS